MEKNKKSGMNSSANERRKKFENWFSPKMYRDAKGIILPGRTGIPDKIGNIMSNADRRTRGYEQDPDLEDYQP